jgi:molybdate transport system substrate-binding protein
VASEIPPGGSSWSARALGVGAALLVTLPLVQPGPSRGEADSIRLYAAGSLRGALTEISRAFTAAYGIPVQLEFGASGLLRERLERGELGTSTPRADPSGDYAWEVFRRAEALRPGSQARLEAKARTLVGGPTSPPPPPDRSVYGQLLAERQADLFLTYCTNAAQAARETPGLVVVPLPPPLAVGADYGLTVLGEAREERASRLVSFILSPAGQAILARHGFTAPTAPGRLSRPVPEPTPREETEQ